MGLERLLDETITGRGLDNRIGLWTAAEAFRELAREELDVTVHAVATLQEEVGLQGAKMISYSLNPDVALVVDVTFATDTPEVKFEDHGETKLGEVQPFIAESSIIRECSTACDQLQVTGTSPSKPTQFSETARMPGSSSRHAVGFQRLGSEYRPDICTHPSNR